jgi:hypothetical protein
LGSEILTLICSLIVLSTPTSSSSAVLNESILLQDET